ncbi:MAG TPA: DsbA family protein [Acidimicrobiales bacterium]|nr:DsbA family protein [Acidimicrobiales bacterium]
MTVRAFSLTYDYRCPFARNAHEHVVEALMAGADWEVEFVPFSLSQVHQEEGKPPVWDDPAKAADLRAIEAGLVVRERYPELFLQVHLALFRARHDEGRDLRDDDVIRAVLTRSGIDGDEVLAEVNEGWPRQAFRKAHEEAATDQKVFGVPTFISGDKSVFVRLMTRPNGDGAKSRWTVENVLDLMEGHPELNEFKHTQVSR